MAEVKKNQRLLNNFLLAKEPPISITHPAAAAVYGRNIFFQKLHRIYDLKVTIY
jgi:hypothetical protein